MRSLLVASCLAVVALSPSRVATQDPPKIDPNRKPGVYAEAGKQIVELTIYADTQDRESGVALASPAAGTFPSTIPTVGAAQARVRFSGVPHLPNLSAFLVNMPGGGAELMLRSAAMVFIVGDGSAGRPAPIHHPMTCKARLGAGVALYRVVSPQLDQSWLRKTYEKDVAKRADLRDPAYVALMVPSNNGIAPRVYSVQVLPE